MNDLTRRWRLTLYNAAIAVVLWPLSYEASLHSAGEGPGVWFSGVSLVALVAAIGATMGAAVGLGHIIADKR